MRWSCSIAPRCVWNCLPGVSVTVCSRPLGSESCTRCPASNGPDPGALLMTRPFGRPSPDARSFAGSLAAFQSGDEVPGGDDADRVAVRVEDEVFRSRGGSHAIEQFLSGEVGRQGQPVLKAP